MPDPYVYTNAAGGVVTANADGLYVNATSCQTADWVATDQTHLYIAYYVGGGLVTWAGIRWLRSGMERARKLREAAAAEARATSVDSSGAGFGDPEERDASGAVLTDSQKQMRRFSPWIFVWVAISILASVASSIIMSNATAKIFTVPESDAISDANNFLKPFGDVFQFFEDGMTVLIGQAIGASDFALVGLLVKWAVVGGFGCGLVGAFISTGFTLVHPVFEFFVPLRQGATLPVGCANIPSSVAELQSLARPYWILTSFSWPASFVTRCLIGVFMGTGETQNWSLASVASSVLSVGLFYAMVNTVPHTTVSGISSFISPIVFVGVASAVFLRKKYRDMFQLNQSLRTPVGLGVAIGAAKDGTALMLKDLALTVQSSVTNMLAANLGLGQQYQLGIFGTLSGNFGYNPSTFSGSIFPIMLAYGIRLTGARFLGERNFRGFMFLARGYLVGALLYGIVAAGSLLWTMDGVPYSFASSELCSYKEQACSLPTYTAVFHNLTPGYVLTAFMTVCMSMYAVLSALLYASLDFHFIRNTTLAVFVAVFVPAAVFAYVAVGTAFAVQFAGALPLVVSTGLYFWRVWFVLFPAVTRGDWGDTAEKMQRSASVIGTDRTRSVAASQPLLSTTEEE